MLSAEWLNFHIDNVMNRVDGLLEHIIYEGLLASGYFPFEKPVSKDMLKRMTPEQLEGYIQSLPTVEEKAAIINKLRDEGVPPSLLPRRP